MNEDRNRLLIRVVAALLAVVVIVAVAKACQPTGDDGSAPGGVNVPGTSTPGPEEPKRDSSGIGIDTTKTRKSPQEYATAREMEQWAAVASRFRVVVGAGEMLREQWLAALRPLVTDEVYQEFSTIREENIQRGKPVGQMKGLRHGDNYVVLEDAWEGPDSWAARYVVQRFDDGWRISAYEVKQEGT